MTILLWLATCLISILCKYESYFNDKYKTQTVSKCRFFLLSYVKLFFYLNFYNLLYTLTVVCIHVVARLYQNPSVA